MRPLILCCVLFALASPAVAQVRPAADAPDALETRVKYADLNLARVSGADAMLGRIDAAARRVCGERPLAAELGKMSRYRACLSVAKASAVARLDAPLVTARYKGEQTAELAAR